MTIYFTSDTHFGHYNIIKYTSRPFETTNEMDSAIVNNINSRVMPDDTLYVLGDFAMGRGINKTEHIQKQLSRINCKNVILVMGNHDINDTELLKSCGFANVVSMLNLKIDGNKFVLCHYPMTEWDGFYQGSYMLHGHVHNQASYNNEMRNRNLRKFDVGVDANNFTPVSSQEIVKYFGNAGQAQTHARKVDNNK